MIKKLLIISSIYVFIFITLCACASTTTQSSKANSSATDSTVVTSSTASSTSLLQTATPTQNTATQEDADSRLPTPAGVVVYEGNLNGAGLVPTVTLTFSAGNDSIYINYRASITTTPGSDRNEIISITDSAGKIRYNQIGPYSYVGDVTLTVQGLPAGITAEDDRPALYFIFQMMRDLASTRSRLSRQLMVRPIHCHARLLCYDGHFFLVIFHE